ncbi:zinc ribbon domain-containing protein [Thermosulfuriphilus ammonigenes]|uniref:Zinc ribbon domain-containing protein n=1 Tax=Thermosulfuriphilus ammonigenes TaxID=1936021 RepID=A0A6G7PXJ1_9BACT|nr:zinc ribbon domain-containing protein [Thermosulfuriphilus ammonigenes]MBA2849740.1 putative FmdB family regulatory protein [Thermosulfuriphilus ammonigenes]QIJ72168.1 zinc ribbon domain-containing protein [Thermosulfuriphilus ammonigenes]
MPIYEFHCQDCGHEFEALLKSREEISEVVCKKCQGRNVKRLMSVARALISGESKSSGPRIVDQKTCDTGTCTHVDLPGYSRS